MKILDETIEIELREGLNRSEKQFTAAELREREKYFHSSVLPENNSEP